ncbi:hypothetical protein UB33_10155 [Photobacterium angustum]|nr:hypothetical protein UB33_10155 [Photobacterium angustum]PSV91987.1 hypothetical protein CTN01_12560 [Photobacterium angustum]
MWNTFWNTEKQSYEDLFKWILETSLQFKSATWIIDLVIIKYFFTFLVKKLKAFMRNQFNFLS